jgi:putative oxidoreductase
MKIAATVARYLLALIFLAFGLNGFLHFIPMPPPTGLALQFFIAVSASHFMAVVFAVQVIGGALLLINRFVPLALSLLSAVIFNIVVFHITMEPSGLPLALFVTALWLLVAASVRSAFSGIFQQRVEPEFAQAPARRRAIEA